MRLLRQLPIIVEQLSSLLSKLVHNSFVHNILSTVFYLRLSWGGNIWDFLLILFLLFWMTSSPIHTYTLISIYMIRSKLSFKLKWPIFPSDLTNIPLIKVSNNIGEKIFMTVRRWTTDGLPACLYSFLQLHLTFWKLLFHPTPHLSGTQFLRKQICSSH